MVMSPAQITEYNRVVAQTIVEEPVPHTPGELDPRVVKGAEWLDANIPDWWGLIDLEKFVIQDYEGCVLGQIYTGWPNPYEHALHEHQFGWEEENNLGFNVYDEEDGAELNDEDGEERWDSLQASWTQVIKDRQKLTP